MFFSCCSWVISILYFFLFLVFSSNMISEEFVLRSLKVSPLTKPFVTPGGWHEQKFVYWNVSVGLKCVHVSRIESLLNLTFLYTFVSKNVVSVSDISAVNLIVGWKLFAFRRNSSISFLLVSHTDMTSLSSSIDSVVFHYDSDSKALKPIYFKNHLINSSVAIVLSSRSMVQPCGRWD